MSLVQICLKTMVETILNVPTHLCSIVYRRLRINRPAAFLAKIELFVANNMGKSYDFSLSDYLFQRSSSVDKDHKHYFCSSLVAKLYKQLGLLP
jgi:hypothetical protein